MYVTINGFPFNNQLTSYREHIEKMAALEPDALIVASPGVIKMAREIAPHIPLHLSTQANVMNVMDAVFYYEHGVKRIIAAREVSLKDCKEIKKELPELEIEIFVHGSMCFAFSGRCLISSLQSGRVPNRGSCANDCRFPYELYAHNEESGTLFKITEDPEGVEGTHIFNAKDLNLSQHIDEILESGIIDSLKIEGRTKSSYYVGLVTRTYAQAIRDFYSEQPNQKWYEEELLTTKNRGFSDGYLVHRPFEKQADQNLDTQISEGSHQVIGEVEENGQYFLCKYKTYPEDISEIIFPKQHPVEESENDIGRIYREGERFYLILHKIITQSGKELESVHSGNTNPIQLPGPLPKYSFLRRKVEE